jgi:hypothetical protein
MGFILLLTLKLIMHIETYFIERLFTKIELIDESSDKVNSKLFTINVKIIGLFFLCRYVFYFFAIYLNVDNTIDVESIIELTKKI